MMVQQAQLIKGRPVRVCQDESRAQLLPDAIDCQDYNAVHVEVLAFGVSPSFVVELQGSDAKGGSYLALSDPNGLQTLTSSKAFDVVVGSSFVKVNLKSVSSGSATISVTPYVSPGQARLSVISMSGA